MLTTLQCARIMVSVEAFIRFSSVSGQMQEPLYWNQGYSLSSDYRAKQTLNRMRQTTKSNLFLLKGTVSRDFLLLVFFMNQFPPSPRVSH
jgi:hypothetical protein